MTRKDYQLIADVFQRNRIYDSFIFDEEARGSAYRAASRVAYDLADALALDNPRFNRDTFLKACGIEVQS